MTIRRNVEIASVILETQSLSRCLATNLITNPSRSPAVNRISALYLQTDSSAVRQTDSRVRGEHIRDCSHTWRAAVSDPASGQVSR